ncbi:Trifunctional enzyme subunit beta-like protein [Dinothrombium tinctorium]|uniref:acetyl-CoA C-acyltransferase n=1 Tax=Dinothrombium tinctorium TaxID=1965070 RepID=A0A3S3PPB6_9ACAR|nr:Trifunctional enzyme subunit beta-like protein [Dinothrombium tinctorium]RWS16586.1 Trifunctional enzyme subunit beta-like protein [Dinothrombium tinctorium]
MSALRRVVIVNGSRTPFLRSGTSYDNLMAYELLRHSLLSLIRKCQIPKETVQYMVAGTVVQEIKTYNVAREAVLASGFNPKATPCHTVTQACISANQAISNACMLIAKGEHDCVVAGGVELLSDLQIRYPKKMRKLMVKANFSKSTKEKLFAFISMLRPSNFFPPDVAPTVEFTTGLNMGEHCEKLNSLFKVTREEQDQFALRSHTLANKALKDGLLTDISPITVPKVGLISSDNGIKVSTVEKVSQLSPVYAKPPQGTITAANATFLTDGASCTLLMSEGKALAMGLKPKAVVKDFIFASLDPKESGLLLGPAHAVAKILKRNKLSLNDFDVFEFHEAFAGQLLANIKAMDSEWYMKNEAKMDQKVGLLPIEKLNTWGGSLSLGHPFGATGSRLVNMASNRLEHCNQNLALIAACAAGGLGHAMILERYRK